MSETTIDNATGTVATSATVAPSQDGGAASTTASADTAVREEGTPPEQAQEPEPKRDRRAEKRIRRLTADKETALREAGYWRGVAEAKASGAASEPNGDAAPQRVPVVEPPAGHQEAIEAVLERLEDAGAEDDDFDEVMKKITKPGFPISTTVRDYFLVSDKPAQMARWVSENEVEVRRISRMTDAVATKALEKVEAKLSAKPAPKKTTGAPPPVSTVGGSSTATFNPAKAEMDDFVEWRKRQKT